MYSPRAMSGAQQQQQRSQFIPTQLMIPTGPSTMERGFQPQSSAGNGLPQEHFCVLVVNYCFLQVVVSLCMSSDGRNIPCRRYAGLGSALQPAPSNAKGIRWISAAVNINGRNAGTPPGVIPPAERLARPAAVSQRASHLNVTALAAAPLF